MPLTLRVNLSIAAVAALVFACTVKAAEKTAETLLNDVSKTALGIHTMVAEVAGSQLTKMPDGQIRGWTWEATCKLKKPNFALVVFSGDPGVQVVASDGRQLYVVQPAAKMRDAQTKKLVSRNATYMRQDTDPTGNAIQADLPQLHLFFSGEIGAGKSADGPVKTRYAGKEKIDGTEYDVVEQSYQIRMQKMGADSKDPGAATPWITRIYVDPDKIVRQVRTNFAGPMGDTELLWVLKKIKLNSNIPDSDFAYVPPSDAVPFTPVAAREVKAQQDQLEAGMLAVGSMAPSFTLNVPAGGQISLSELLKGRKAILINFWFNGCGPCQAEFPRLQHAYDRWKDKGFDLLAIDNGDSASLITEWAKRNKYTFRTAMAGARELDTEFPIIKQYGVPAYPTSYLIGATGKVLWRHLGPVNDEELQAALTAAGVR